MPPEARRELLTYHRLNRAMQNICRECLNNIRREPRKCFVCGRTYTEEEKTAMRPAREVSGQTIDLGTDAQAIGQVLRNLSADKEADSARQREAAWRLWAERLKEKGIMR